MPATYAVRPLVVISIVEQVAEDPGYSLQIADIERWEASHTEIPAGSVVMVRSDWSNTVAGSGARNPVGLSGRIARGFDVSA